MVYTTLQRQGLHRVNLGITNYILQMPLNGINPVLRVKTSLYRARCKWILARGIYMVLHVVITYTLFEYRITKFTKSHFLSVYAAKLVKLFVPANRYRIKNTTFAS